MAEERLQKVLAAAGVASRRNSEAMIAAGRVSVDGVRVTEMGTKVDPETAEILVDGKPIALPERHVYLKLHKPRDVISDIGGERQGRQTVEDLIPKGLGRLFPVGRLDLKSEGLILLTDDGDMAHKLTHPRYEHPKTYYVLVADRPTQSSLERLREGVELPDGITAPAQVQVGVRLPEGIQLASGPTQGVWMEIVLREGKKRQIRLMTAAVGCPTLRLIRWAIGPLELGGLPVGQSTPLTRNEVAALRAAMRGERTRMPARATSTDRPAGRNTRPSGPGRSAPKAGARGGAARPDAAKRRAAVRRGPVDRTHKRPK
jgi:pseudouridine synthase